MGLAVFGLGLSRRRRRSACQGSERHLAGIWDASCVSPRVGPSWGRRAPRPRPRSRPWPPRWSGGRWTGRTRIRSACEAHAGLRRAVGSGAGAADDVPRPAAGRAVAADGGAPGRGRADGGAGLRAGGLARRRGRCADVRTLQEAVSPPEDPPCGGGDGGARGARAGERGAARGPYRRRRSKVALAARERARRHRSPAAGGGGHLLCAAIAGGRRVRSRTRARPCPGLVWRPRRGGIWACSRRVLYAQAWLHGYGPGTATGGAGPSSTAPGPWRRRCETPSWTRCWTRCGGAPGAGGPLLGGGAAAARVAGTAQRAGRPSRSRARS